MKLAGPSLRETARVDASRKFGRYKPEEERIESSAEVRGDELELLRRKREMLRSMSPEETFSVIVFHEGLNFFEALALAKKEGKIIVPNYVHDRILTETEVMRYSAWTGTFVIYEAPGKPFGEKVVHGWKDDADAKYNISTLIPEKFRGKKNCALVLEHPDFDLVNLGNDSFELKADEMRIHLLEKYPKKSQEWYKFDERFRIPIGSPKRRNNSSRCLFRLDDVCLGPVARHFDGGLHTDRRYIDLVDRPSYGFGVAVF